MKIMIVDDHPLILDGFATAIRKYYPETEVHTASDAGELFSFLSGSDIDILFLDIRLKRSDARDFVKKLRVKHPDLKIVIISSLGDLPTIETLFKQGVNGYLLKSDPKSEISRAIKTVLSGQKFTSLDIEERYFTHQIKKSDHNETNLTPREKEILKLILKGKTTKEISKDIFLAEKTIENHRSSLFIKFEVKNVAGLVKKAILEGYL